LRTQEYERIKRQTAELVFKRLCEKAGVFRPSTARYQPRLHDFRHTFAVVRLVTWYRENKNEQRLLPHLTSYLGTSMDHEDTALSDHDNGTAAASQSLL
jgi:integrase/recombinase XerD